MIHKKTAFLIAFTLVFFLTACYVYCPKTFPVFGQFFSSLSPGQNPVHVVIDAGHGGKDPGKIGINNTLEKDINLAIATKLRDYLIAAGYTTVMTREDDSSLAEESAANQKLSDFKNRTTRINSSSPQAVISIHQNSFSDPSIMGTQVFYPGSKSSRVLASFIQEECRRLLNPSNHRNIKENSDYYLFRHVSSPIVIVECGFLSNPEEAALLIQENYQQKTAWAIYMGCVRFLKTLE